MAQYRLPDNSLPRVNVTKDSPTVSVRGVDARGEVKLGDYFKLEGVPGVYEIGSVGAYSGGHTAVTLTAPWQGETATNRPAIFHRDFDPERGYPLIYAGDLDVPDILRRWALMVAGDMQAAIDQLGTLQDSVGSLQDVAAALGSASREDVGDQPLQLPRNLDFGTAAFVDWEQIIPQSGSNENGHWIRFPDGTQICRTKLVLPYSTAERCNANWTFPMPFADADYQVSYMNEQDAASWRYSGGRAALGQVMHWLPGIHVVGVSQYRIQGQPDFVAGDFVTVSVTAIGRWK